MSCTPEARREALRALKATSDIVTVPVEDKRLREIVADQSADEEKRRLAYELLSARTTIALQSELARRGEK